MQKQHKVPRWKMAVILIASAIATAACWAWDWWTVPRDENGRPTR